MAKKKYGKKKEMKQLNTQYAKSPMNMKFIWWFSYSNSWLSQSPTGVGCALIDVDNGKLRKKN